MKENPDRLSITRTENNFFVVTDEVMSTTKSVALGTVEELLDFLEVIYTDKEDDSE